MANDSIRVEYNQDLEPLVELLTGVERVGDFVASGVMEIPMPKLEVEGVGVLSFPVPSTQVAALLQQATRAPYGRGAETLLDESVRKVWQLPPDKVRIGGKSWAVNFDNILKRATAGLGCEGMAVSVELYKLLVYDLGGFFQAHRDTEKTRGMFGTLVIVLPSSHRGGELVVRHAGREVTVDLAGAEVSEVSFVAFYADCEHEVRPITEGNRVCLVYNLIQPQSAPGKVESLRAPDYERQTAAAAKLLEEKLSAPGAPAKIAWLLEHQYSPEGLSFAGLKSTDAARAQVLAQAAARADCAAHLGVVHIEESGAAQEVYHNYPRRGWGRYRGNDEDDVKDAGSDDFEVIEVSDRRHYVSQWRDLRDQPVAFGEIPIQPGELLPAGALDDVKPDEQRLMEATGNEGASFERSYHRAALVIWRHERYAEVLLQAGVVSVLPYLGERIAASEARNAPAAVRKSAVTLARQLVQAWQEAPEYAGYRQPSRPEKRDGMLSLLQQLGDAALLEEFVAEVVTRDYDGSDNAALVAGVRLLAAKKLGTLYAELINQHLRHRPGDCVELLHTLAFKSELAADEVGRAALRRIAGVAVSQLDEVGKKPRDDDEWPAWPVSKEAPALDAIRVAKLLDVLGLLGAAELRVEAGDKFAARPGVFDPVTILVPALGLVRERDDAVARLWEHSTGFLLRRSGRPPDAPRDWHQDAKVSCSCTDCRELQAFTLDPVEQLHRFRVRQDRRQHLHQQIEKHRLDMTHVTERKGSPQTLVCKKDRRGYQRRCEQYVKDIAALTELEKLASNIQTTTAGRQKIEASRRLASKWSPA